MKLLPPPLPQSNYVAARQLINRACLLCGQDPRLYDRDFVAGYTRIALTSRTDADRWAADYVRQLSEFIWRRGIHDEEDGCA